MDSSNRRLLSRVSLVGWLLLIAEVAASQTWQLEYDPTLGTLPSAQGWTARVVDPAPADGLSEGNYLVAQGALTQGDTGGVNADPANQQYYELSLGTIDLDDDVLQIDLRLQILASTLTETGVFRAAGFGIHLRDNASENVSFFVSDTGLLLQNIITPSASPFVAYDTASGFVDYRLRIERSVVRLFVAGVEVAALERDSFWLNGNDRNFVRFGDISTTDYGSSQIERLVVSRFTPSSPDVRNYGFDTAFSPTNSTGTKTQVAFCPPGSSALTGGVSTIGAEGSVGISASRPGPENPPTSWIGSGREVVDTRATWQLRVDVICGEIAGYERVAQAEPVSTDGHQSSMLECPGAKNLIAGGAGFGGANLRQVLQRHLRRGELEPDPFYDWQSTVTDFGQAASVSPWSAEAVAICSDAQRVDRFAQTSPQTPTSPKSWDVDCAGGKVPIGGGAGITGGGPDGFLRISRPTDATTPGDLPIGWDAEAQGTGPLFSLEVTIACAPIADPTVSKSGLLARWAGEFDPVDTWGWAHGTMSEFVNFAPGLHGEGHAFSFGGMVDQWVELPSFTSDFDGVIDLYPEAGFSVAAWIQTSTNPPAGSTATVAALYDFGGASPINNPSTWFIDVNDAGLLRGYVRSTDQAARTLVTGTTIVTDGEFHHVALVRDTDAGRLRLYVDGALDAEGTTSSGGSGSNNPLVPANPVSPDPVTIGIFRAAGAGVYVNPFEGLIDDVLYYDRRLTSEELQNMAGCGRMLTDRTLNVEAALFGSPVGDEHGLCVFLEAGSYHLTLVDPTSDSEARFSGWSPSESGAWGTIFRVDPEIDASFSFGLPVSADSGEAAFANTLVKQRVLDVSTPQRVYFSLEEDRVLDNRGGVSIRLLPEPNTGTLLRFGGLLLAFLERRRG